MNEHCRVNGATARLWRPKVVPLPTSKCRASTIHTQPTSHLLTRTNLTSDQSTSAVSDFNRQILMSSQSYNSSPKPFTRQQAVAESATEVLGTQEQDSASHSSKQQWSQQVQPVNMISDATTSAKLIHKQYNSPLDLYSMNNIRKTIEAHSEMIAPGVKGVNFLKSDTPVNKNSEVYKLVMEEERKRHQRNEQTGETYGNTNSTPTMNVSMESDKHLKEHYASPMSNHSRLRHTIDSSEVSADVGVDRQKLPACFSCGNYITGVFAKVQDHHVHPHCFNCSTCGASLKNSGYFTVNDKLYCEIHAKQVAKFWRLPGLETAKTNRHMQPAQFPETSSGLNQARSDYSLAHNHVCCHQPHDCHGKPQSPPNNNSALQQRRMVQASSTGTRQTTISTMFENMMSSSRSEEQMKKDLSLGQVTNENISTEKNARFNSSLIRSSNRDTIANGHDIKVHLSQATHNCNSCPNINAPVCQNCKKHIHGPYILAGKSTWCKQCSQSDFVCNKCKRSLMEIGFIEADLDKYYCQTCYEDTYAPICSRCNRKVIGECLNALGKQWHPNCFVCGHCRLPFGNSSFYLEDKVAYCEEDWNKLFTTKCSACLCPIEAGDKWIEALNKNYHSDCFRCTNCRANLEGSTFYCKNGKPYCRSHQH